MDEEDKKPNCKVVLLGNSGVGKTSLVMRWTTGNYQKAIKPTIGANHQRKSVQIGKEEIDLYLWDTAGQEQFQALTPLYARSAASAVIVASIDDLESFNALEGWVNLLNTSCEKVPPALLAVNKTDLTESSVFSCEEIESRFGSMFSAIFFVSAQTGEGVNTAFMHAAQTGYEFMKQANASAKSSAVNLTQKKKDAKCC